MWYVMAHPRPRKDPRAWGTPWVETGARGKQKGACAADKYNVAGCQIFLQQSLSSGIVPILALFPTRDTRDSTGSTLGYVGADARHWHGKCLPATSGCMHRSWRHAVQLVGFFLLARS